MVYFSFPSSLVSSLLSPAAHALYAAAGSCPAMARGYYPSEAGGSLRDSETKEKTMFLEITPENVDYTIGQLALLQASGHDVGEIASAYAEIVARGDAEAEQDLALQIESDYNRLFYS